MVADPVAVVVADAAADTCIVNAFVEAVKTSKVLSVNTVVAYPDPLGTVTDEKVNKSPATKPCADLFTVIVCGAPVLLIVKVAPVIAESKGVISKNCPE